MYKRQYVSMVCKVTILASILFFPAQASAEALKFKRLFIVGDSLSDGGAYSNLAKFTLINSGMTSPPDINYKFTNNNADGSPSIWNDFFGARLGIEMAPNIINGVPAVGAVPPPAGLSPEELEKYNQLANAVNVGGNNYAQGGARIEGTSISENLAVGVTAIPVNIQVDRLLSDVGGKFHKNDLVVVFAGGNDAFAHDLAANNGLITRDQAKENMTGAVAALESQVERLQAAGAKNIIVMSSPSGTDANNSPLPAIDLHMHFNNELRTSRHGKDGLLIDFDRLIDAIRATPEKYGFVPTGGGALTNLTCGAALSLYCLDQVNTIDGGPYYLADFVHLSQQMNMNISDFVFASIKAASQNASITTRSLSTLRQHSLSLEDRLVPGAFIATNKYSSGAKRKVGHPEGYASLEGGYFETESGQIDAGTNTNTQSLKAGADLVVSKNMLIGVSVGFTRSDVEYEDKSGGFESHTIVGSLYSNIALTKSAYINAVLGAGHIDLDDITRNFNIGPSEESYSGDTTGDYRLARIGGGFVLPLNRWSINPAIAYSYERVKINGYSENIGAASMAFGDNELESSRLTASLTVSYNPIDPSGWKPMFRASLEHEFEEDDLKVNLGPDANTIGALYLERPDGTYGYLTGGVSKKIGANTSFGINATTIVGQKGVTGVTGGISIKSNF